MVGPINSAVAGALFGQPNVDTGVGLGLDAELLASWASARAAQTADIMEVTADPNAPTAALWAPGISPRSEVYLQRALGGKAFFDTSVKLLSDLGATGDYRRLFALHSGISALQALAERASVKDISRPDKAQATREFERGLKELEEFFAAEKFEDVRLAQGDRVEMAQTTLALPTRSEDYSTGVIHRGTLGATLAGLDPNAKFDIVARSSLGTERRVSIDLAQMGSIPRSLSNVISHVNAALTAAGAASRLVAVDQTPKMTTVVVAGRTIESRYVGPKHYALRVDVRSGERVSFEPVAPRPAFYAVGSVNGGARLIKLEDVNGEPGEPVLRERPAATADPIGANVAAGWLGPGAPYQSAPAGAYEQRTNVMFSGDLTSNNFENALRDPGEAVLRLKFEDGRVLTVVTAWRSDDLEAWRQRAGESSDRAIADDLAERLTQLLYEQGVAAGVDVHQNGNELSFSINTGDFVEVSSFEIGGRLATLTPIDPPNMVDGLREGVFARRFEAAAVATVPAQGEPFIGTQTVTITTAAGAEILSVNAGETGMDAATLAAQLNQQLKDRGIAASASLVTNGSNIDLYIDALHSVTAVSASVNGGQFTAGLLAPGAWAEGGLPTAGAGQPFGDAVRVTDVAGAPPLLSATGDVDLEIVVATPTGARTVTVSVSAAERLSDPDPMPGVWSAAFQQRLDAALNAAGVYVDAQGADLTRWAVAEDSGQRLVSVSVNGTQLTLAGASPALGIGGAFSVERSLTSASMATGENDDVAALIADPNISVTFDTIWGARTVSTALETGDPRTLTSVALRLNEALAAAGYDLGVVATPVSEGGAGLRFVTGASHSVRNVSEIGLGAQTFAATLDPIDSVSRTDDPLGAERVAERASRGAAATETNPSASTLIAPSGNPGGWFPGRAFDVAIGGGAKVATAHAVATGADGSVFVLADLDGDSATSVIKGSRDVALLKYDSVGKLVFSEILGAAQSASGFALSVSADGKIAVAGAVEGALSGAEPAKGGLDSFVSVYDSNGGELWTSRRAATGADEALAVSFASDGTVIVAGKTNSSLGPALALGGADGYVRGYSALGAELFTRQFGSGGDDAASALLVRNGAGGALEIFTAGVESGRGVVRKFSYSSGGGLAVGATRDIGYFHGRAIHALAADGAALYVGGVVGVGGLSLGLTARGAVAGGEGFVARMDADLVSAGLDRATYVGSSQDDVVRNISIVGGAIYAAGVTGGVLGARGTSKVNSAFLARLDDAGDIAWSRTFNSTAGAFSLNSMAVDAGGASGLDALGLPRGVVAALDTNGLASRSALRVGDEFRIGADGRQLTRIRIGAGVTLSSLAATINRAIGASGRAEIVRENGAERLKITPRDGNALRIEGGRAGVDALPALGLSAGVVASNKNLQGGMKTFGLGLVAQDLKLGTSAEITRTKAELSAALSIIRQAYDGLVNPNAKELTPEEEALAERKRNVGVAPAHITAQLAGYQAALTRLRGY